MRPALALVVTLGLVYGALALDAAQAILRSRTRAVAERAVADVRGARRRRKCAARPRRWAPRSARAAMPRRAA